MADGSSTRSVAASAVGWLIVAIVVWLIVRSLIGVLGWATRGLLVIVALAFLLNLWFRLKARDD